ncbi:MAG: histidine triad nucleotide-binding protein [Candidatus Lambdaproteobacteria bacterium RIFOXYD1_FULL_56_27]|uniref:Histidine triad nucleotide-binding protein n=1 Tax=Candidatus Lambdaproteobacteria bacterium RIFOXYD2_FULL_56_26 TaxID=1817773 RepID=A0A1F6GQ25_9PROT|nr:MAG: histidine triad nucleotide-binding protein [Candidatus Lambdaproteobacteria bacterium RIFOXYD2_FULL_56_26]OGH03667.1 MAG: histidine triad nucleotide-binding protein [Candidatus Lambdaproteobacteria bacterium RIFOXYC1_FULL_56_13]OGH07251.1 MAG: histidine triad nucleotide-binding protein [Candidatus Lambdaproteobacteria bacterium RIFOXYD1_FULL_56_27]
MSENCLFCKIASKAIAAKVVAEDDGNLAFWDLNPQAPTHVLVIPKGHLGRIGEAQPQDQERLGRLMLFAAQVAEQLGLKDYRLVINNGAGAGQTVFHLHLHLLAGREFSWPPG